MRWMLLLVALAISFGLSLLLSAVTHSFIFFAFLPILFVPFFFSRPRSGI